MTRADIRQPAPSRVTADRMRHFLARLSLLILLNSFLGVCPADESPPPKTIDSRQDQIWLDGHLSYLRDPTGEMTFEQVREAAENGRFQPARSWSVPSGYLAGKPIWLQFAVDYPANQDSTWWLHIAPEMLEQITVYAEQPDGRYTIHQGGRLLPFRQRELETITHAFRLGPDPGGVRRYFVRITLNLSIKIEPSLWQEKPMISFITRVNGTIGVYVGIVLLLMIAALYRVIHYRTPWDIAYFAYLLGFELFHLNTTGLIQSWGITDSTPIRFGLIQLGTLMTGLSYAGLTRTLIVWPPGRSHWVRQSMQYALGGWALILLLTIALYPDHLADINFMGAASLLVISLLAGLWASWKGYPNARALALCFLPFVLYVVFFTLNRFIEGWDIHTWTRNRIVMGTTLLHMIPLWLLVLGRDARMRQAREKLEAEVANLKNEMSNTTLFLGMLTHELSRPLQALTGLIRPNRSREARVDDALRHQLAAINTEFTGIIETCTDRILQASSSSLEPTFIQLQKLIQGIANHFQQKTGRHLIRCDLKALPAEFRCDPKLIGILISNLVDNAIRHSSEGGAIWITGHALDSDAIELSVTDEGPGIPEAFQDRIFDRYYQLEQGVTKKAGMGLGLFIVKRIAEMHGGTVVCESKPGEGASFLVTLKCCELGKMPG